MTVHIVGAGIAGLSAALALSERGIPILLHEATPQAGGRCRSWQDPTLGILDNGTHLVLSGNAAVTRYLERAGSTAEMPAETPVFPFADVRSGKRWSVDLRRPWQLGLGALGMLKPFLTGADTSVSECLGHNRLWETLWRPLSVAALNTEPEAARARSLAAILRASLLKGPGACAPRLARTSLAAAFVDPALNRLPPVRHRHRLTALEIQDDQLTGLRFADGEFIETRNAILALPAWEVSRLLPDLMVPDDHRAIINLHVHCKTAGPRLLGLIGGTGEWLSWRDGVASITVSAADRLLDQDAETLARSLWQEVAGVLGATPELPPGWQMIREKRATFAATSAQEKLRPSTTSGPRGLTLAGDWTATGLPATLEGACRSGEAAARQFFRN
ncbi:hydroxysqualene dehydroxylase HpnE [Lacibacterium aquatile]|uniref:Hydroxysqualene dehydroxylase HpnE n=1 Tax=Lacibacterium aquatile TaxID=1168082 RepID=A0ABW5DUD8_9PROT